MYDERDSKNIPAVTVYDVLDRATLLTLPDGSETATEYTTDNSGHALVTTVTDALVNRQASYTSGSGKTLKTEQLSGPDGEITTTFEYDGIQRLVRVTDNEGQCDDIRLRHGRPPHGGQPSGKRHYVIHLRCARQCADQAGVRGCS